MSNNVTYLNMETGKLEKKPRVIPKDIVRLIRKALETHAAANLKKDGPANHSFKSLAKTQEKQAEIGA